MRRRSHRWRISAFVTVRPGRKCLELFHEQDMCFHRKVPVWPVMRTSCKDQTVSVEKPPGSRWLASGNARGTRVSKAPPELGTLDQADSDDKHHGSQLSGNAGPIPTDSRIEVAPHSLITPQAHIARPTVWIAL